MSFNNKVFNDKYNLNQRWQIKAYFLMRLVINCNTREKGKAKK